MNTRRLPFLAGPPVSNPLAMRHTILPTIRSSIDSRNTHRMTPPRSPPTGPPRLTVSLTRQVIPTLNGHVPFSQLIEPPFLEIFENTPDQAIMLASTAMSGYPDCMSLLTPDALPADPLDALRELTRSEAELDDIRHQQVAAARDTGASWDQIGDALGMSRQSAWEYFAKRASEHLTAVAVTNTDLSEEDAMSLAVEELKAVRRRRRRG